jgi:SSS family solute:Na+ symporter
MFSVNGLSVDGAGRPKNGPVPVARAEKNVATHIASTAFPAIMAELGAAVGRWSKGLGTGQGFAMHLHAIDYAILAVYTLFVLGIGFALKRYMKSSTDFFLSGRAIPAWIAALAFVSANLGANEVIGMGACGAKYGMMTCHFYWLGAVAAMLFVGVFMMPFYYGSKARSVPEYLKLRFDEKTRGFNAISFAVMTVFQSGISMYVMSKFFQLLLGWSFNFSVYVSAAIVLVYITLGGLTSAIYNEVLQFFLIVLGFMPLCFLGLIHVGGWHGLATKLAVVAERGVDPQQPELLMDAPTNPAPPGKGLAGHNVPAPAGEATKAPHYPATAWTSVWANMGSPKNNPMHVGWFGMVMGLGFVLAFGYWCTDFLVVQRAMAAESMSAARRTPVIATIPKIMIPAIVIVPGMIALVTQPYGDLRKPLDRNTASVEDRELASQFGLIPAKYEDVVVEKDGVKTTVRKVKRDADHRIQPDYDLAIPKMLMQFFPTGLLGLGMTALMASFMSGMAGNVTAFNTVWTYDIYQSYIAPNRSDKHYLWMGRMATVFGILVSIAAAYVAAQFNNIMDFIQLVFSFVNAPLFATFLLGMFWKRTTGHGAFFGLLSGTLTALVHQAVTAPKGGWLAPLCHFQAYDYKTDMAQNFWMATYAWTACFIVTIVISLLTRRKKSDDQLRGLVYSLTPRGTEHDHLAWYAKPAALAVLMLAVTIVLNIIFW